MLDIEYKLFDKIDLITVYRIVADKGFDLLIKACKKIKDEGYSFKLFIIGGSSVDCFDEFLSNLVKEINMENEVVFTCTHKNSYKYMNKCDIYIQSARTEAYGITIREAQYLALPVISTKTHGGYELILDGYSGMLCDISVEDIYNKLKILLDNPELMAKIKKNCKELGLQDENYNILSTIYDIVE